MNRRKFITVSAVGAIGVALPQFVLPESAKHLKYLPENLTVLVNESPKVCELSKNSWPIEWQILGHTVCTTKLLYDSKRINEVLLTEISVEKLDIKLTGIPVNPNKVRQVAFVLNNKLTDGKLHLLSRNALLTRIPYTRSKEEKPTDFVENASYIATFFPFRSKGSKKLSYFEMTFYS